MVKQQTRDDFAYLPLESAIVPPPGLIHHYRDYFWFVDPERGLLFYKSSRWGRHPQANPDMRVQQMMAKHYPWAEIQQIPSVFVPVTHDGTLLVTDPYQP